MLGDVAEEGNTVERSPHRRFRGLMQRAWSVEHGWLVSFAGHLFFRVSEMPRLGNIEQMEREIAGKGAAVTRIYFSYHDIEIITVVSSRRAEEA